jgi:hypothetical protein
MNDPDDDDGFNLARGILLNAPFAVALWILVWYAFS